MSVVVVTPGRLQHPGTIVLANDYLARIQRIVPCRRPHVREERRRDDGPRAREREGQAVAAAVPAGAWAVLMDAGGRTMDSDAFHGWLVKRLEASITIAFMIGGPDGHGDAAVARADERISLSAMTLPHELAEVLLLEAIYRALTRWRGLPYHR